MSEREQALALRYLKQMSRSGVCSTCPLHEFNHEEVTPTGIDRDSYVEDLERLAAWAQQHDVWGGYEEDAPTRVDMDPEGKE